MDYEKEINEMTSSGGISGVNQNLFSKGPTFSGTLLKRSIGNKKRENYIKKLISDVNKKAGNGSIMTTNDKMKKKKNKTLSEMYHFYFGDDN